MRTTLVDNRTGGDSVHRSTRRLLAVVFAAATSSLAAAGPATATDAPTRLRDLRTRSWDVVTADWDGDGDLDVFVSRHSGTLAADRWWLAQPDGTFTPDPQTLPPADRHGCATGDVDGDRSLELLCQVGGGRGVGEGPNELWDRTADGLLVDVARAWRVEDRYARGRRPVLVDVNGDGLDDVYLTAWATVRPDGRRNENRLLLSTGTSTVESFTSVTGGRGSRCVTVGDWNGDGRPDIVTCGSDLELHLNRGAGRFQDVTHLLGGRRVTWPRDARLVDVDGDGVDDLVVADAETVQLRLNRRRGFRFASVSRSWPHRAAERLAIVDLAGGRRPDVYVVQGVHADRNWPDLLIVDTSVKTAASMVAVGAGGQAAPLDRGVVVTHGNASTRGPIQVIGPRTS